MLEVGKFKFGSIFLKIERNIKYIYYKIEPNYDFKFNSKFYFRLDFNNFGILKSFQPEYNPFINHAISSQFGHDPFIKRVTRHDPSFHLLIV